jgi:hypothetical protein
MEWGHAQLLTVPSRDSLEIVYLVAYGPYFTPDLRMNAFFHSPTREWVPDPERMFQIRKSCKYIPGDET